MNLCKEVCRQCYERCFHRKWGAGANHYWDKRGIVICPFAQNVIGEIVERGIYNNPPKECEYTAEHAVSQ